jgi:uncharacterized protein YhfF
MRLVLASMLTKCQTEMASIVQQANIRSALCITTAANVYPPEQRSWQQDEMAALRQLGVELDEFDLEGKDHATVMAKLALHNTVYVTGGNSYYLLEQMRRSSFDQEILSWTTESKTYIGCSAGAVVACPRIDHIGTMDDPKKSILTEYAGLGLYPELVMPHADHPEYGPIAQAQILEWANKSYPITPLNDDQVIVCNLRQEQFGDSPEQINQLAQLIATGQKTAACGDYKDYGPLEKIGDLVDVLDAAGKKVCTVKITDVAICKFCDVTEEFAFAEGEGDRSLSSWQAEHQRFFTAQGNFSESMPLVCLRFRLVE